MRKLSDDRQAEIISNKPAERGMGTLIERAAKGRIGRAGAAKRRAHVVGEEPAKKALKARAEISGRSGADLSSAGRATIKSPPPRPSSKAALNALPTAICQTDAEGWIAYHNAAAAELWGRSPGIGESRWCGSCRLYWPDGRPLAPEASPIAA